MSTCSLRAPSQVSMKESSSTCSAIWARILRCCFGSSSGETRKNRAWIGSSGECAPWTSTTSTRMPGFERTMTISGSSHAEEPQVGQRDPLGHRGDADPGALQEPLDQLLLVRRHPRRRAPSTPARPGPRRRPPDRSRVRSSTEARATTSSNGSSSRSPFSRRIWRSSGSSPASRRLLPEAGEDVVQCAASRHPAPAVVGEQHDARHHEQAGHQHGTWRPSRRSARSA